MTSFVSSYPYLAVDVDRCEHAVTVSLRGEADIATGAYLEAALVASQLDGADALYLDVAELEFCDIDSLCRLVVFAHDMRQAGREVITCGARPLLRKLAHLLGATAVLGIS